ncbi:MAG: hypothetical protein ACW99U_06495 [Candidatus Thorarchaeota archaeon]
MLKKGGRPPAGASNPIDIFALFEYQSSTFLKTQTEITTNSTISTIGTTIIEGIMDAICGNGVPARFPTATHGVTNIGSITVLKMFRIGIICPMTIIGVPKAGNEG